MNRTLIILLLLTAGLGGRTVAGPVDILVLTASRTSSDERESRDPSRSGFGAELIERIMTEANLSYSTETQPHARALLTLESNPRAVFYALTRTPERESRYQWIGKLGHTAYYLYRLKERNDIRINTLDDARRYRIGVVRGDVRADYLHAQGFKEGVDKGLQTVVSRDLIVRMQQARHVDLIILSAMGMKRVCEAMKLDCSAYVPAFKLDLAAELWLVAGPGMPPAVVDSLRKAYKQQMDSGFLEKLMQSGRPIR